MKYRIFWAVAALVALTACNKVEDYQKPSTIPAKASLAYTLMIAPEALNSFDFFVKYYDADGNVISEQVQAKEWTKTVVVTKFPATLGLLFETKPKDGIDTNAAYEWKWDYKQFLFIMNANNGVIYQYPVAGGGSSFQIPEGKLVEYFQKGIGTLVNSIFNIQSNGTVTTGEWQ